MAKTVTKPRKVIHGRIGIFAELPKSTIKELKRRCALTKPPTPQWKVIAQAMAQRVATKKSRR
jgi:hypothetical protein